jgi:hypothetical protein
MYNNIRYDPDPGIDRAYAERCMNKENQEKESTHQKVKKKFVTIPNGGRSKSARSKQNQTLGAVFNQTVKALGQDNVTPSRYRTGGFNNALRSTLPNERGAYRV